jgi:hypothetical protein
MVCTCAPIRTVSIAISSRWSCTFHECHRRQRIVPLWRLRTHLRVSQQRPICDLNTGFLHNSRADQRRRS